MHFLFFPERCFMDIKYSLGFLYIMFFERKDFAIRLSSSNVYKGRRSFLMEISRSKGLEVIYFVVYEVFFLVYMLLNLKSQHKPCT